MSDFEFLREALLKAIQADNEWAAATERLRSVPLMCEKHRQTVAVELVDSAFQASNHAHMACLDVLELLMPHFPELSFGSMAVVH